MVGQLERVWLVVLAGLQELDRVRGGIRHRIDVGVEFVEAM